MGGIVCSRVLTVTIGLWSGLYRLLVAVAGRSSCASCGWLFGTLFGVDWGIGDEYPGSMGPRAGSGETSLLSNPEAVFIVICPVRFIRAFSVVSFASTEGYSTIWSIVILCDLASPLISFMLESGWAVFTYLYTWFLRLTRVPPSTFGKSSKYLPVPFGTPLKMSVATTNLPGPLAESSDGGGKRSSIHFLENALDALGPRFYLPDCKCPAIWLCNKILLPCLSLI